MIWYNLEQKDIMFVYDYIVYNYWIYVGLQSYCFLKPQQYVAEMGPLHIATFWVAAVTGFKRMLGK